MEALASEVPGFAQRTVLVVDDESVNLRLFTLHLAHEGHRTLAVASGAEAIVAARTERPDLILLDLFLPGMSGIDVAKTLKSDPITKNIPIVMITAAGDRASRLAALESGVEEFLEKPVERTELLMRVRNLLRLKEYQHFLENHNAILERQVAERARQLTLSYREAILTLGRAAEYKDEETGAHVQRIGHYSERLASLLGLDEVFRDRVFHAAPMHDVGKIGIPDAVLLNPGKLDASEWEIMKTHTVIGASVLATGASPYALMGADIARGHHERWDGTGYPEGLRGEQIPLAARIVALCDVYEALRSKRPYKPAFSHERALDIICRGDERTKPEHFDPDVREAFRKAASDFEEIYAKLAD